MVGMDGCKILLSTEKPSTNEIFIMKNNKGAKSITCAENKTLIANIHFTSII